VVGELEEEGILDRTLVVFTSDNGFFAGEHRQQQGKILPYEESVRVPLLVRGPGIGAGGERTDVVADVDLVPTIADLTGVAPGRVVDGRSLLEPEVPGRAVVLEASPIGAFPGYAGLRAEQWKYIEWDDGFVELYNLAVDPGELVNRATDPTLAADRKALHERLLRLRYCAGDTCRE
jgi:arylsulfatase A-like enzyme